MVTFSKKSWHYQLATLRDIAPRDLCGYTRQLLRNLLLCVVVFGIVLAAWWSFSNLASWFIVGITNTFTDLDPIATPAGITILALSLTGITRGAAWLLKSGRRKMYRKVIDDAPTSFIKSQYQRFRKKVCHHINFVE